MARRSNASVLRMQALMRRLPKESQAAIKSAIMAEAGRLVAYMQIAAPKDTGALERSIRIEDMGRTYVRVRAGGDATTVRTRKGWGGTYDYALAQEFGTREQPGKPFFYATARGSRKRIKSTLTDKARNAIVKAFENA